MWITVGLIGKDYSVRLYVTKKNKVLHVSGNQSTQNFVKLVAAIFDCTNWPSAAARKKASLMFYNLLNTSSSLSMQLEKSPSKGVTVRLTDEESKAFFSSTDCCFISK